jgi:hypothetical protein
VKRVRNIYYICNKKYSNCSVKDEVFDDIVAVKANQIKAFNIGMKIAIDIINRIVKVIFRKILA